MSNISNNFEKNKNDIVNKFLLSQSQFNKNISNLYYELSIKHSPQYKIQKAYEEYIKEFKFAEKNKKPEESDEELAGIDSGLLDFLEADSYEKKLEILSMLHPRINDHMIDTMAVSLDIEVKDGDIEQRYSEILNCLITMEKFECNRLR